jgi:hypothetical protein
VLQGQRLAGHLQGLHQLQRPVQSAQEGPLLQGLRAHEEVQGLEIQQGGGPSLCRCPPSLRIPAPSPPRELGGDQRGRDGNELARMFLLHGHRDLHGKGQLAVLHHKKLLAVPVEEAVDGRPAR